MIFLLLPILSRLGYGLNWREAMVLAWGGLRGAVGLALALFVSLDGSISDTRFRTLTFFFISAIVLLTLLIQGTTTPLLLQASLASALDQCICEQSASQYLQKATDAYAIT